MAQISVSTKKISARHRRLERLVKGFANHRRIQMLELLEKSPEMNLQEIADTLKVEMKTACEHLRKLTVAGLILKRYEGREVKHALSPKGFEILAFLNLQE